MPLLACLLTHRKETIGLVGTDEGSLRWESETPGLAEDAERFVPLDSLPESGGHPAVWAIKRLAWFLPGRHTVLAEHLGPDRFYGGDEPDAPLPAGGDTLESCYVPTVAEINAAAREADPNPTHAQRESGGYRKGHISIHGLKVTIENAKGSMRRGVSANGKPWAMKMLWPYGYLKRTSGADEEHLDCFLGPCPESEVVFIVDQNKFDGSFDEHKIFLGWTNSADVKKAYLAHYSPSWKGFAGVKPMALPDFKAWIERGATRGPVALNESRAPAADLLEDKSLFGPGFTGTMKDSLGRLMTFVDGKHVKGTGRDDEHPKELVHAKMKGKIVHVAAYDPDHDLAKIVDSAGTEQIVKAAEINRVDPATKEADEEAESYMDERMPLLDKLVDDAEANGEVVTVVSGWESLDDDYKDQARDNWIENNVNEFYDSAVETWRETLGEATEEDLRGDSAWHDLEFTTWATEQGFTMESATAAIADRYKPLRYEDVTWSKGKQAIQQAVLDLVNGGPEPRLAPTLQLNEVYEQLKTGLYPAITEESQDALMDVAQALADIAPAQRRTRVAGGHSYTKDGMDPDFTKLRYKEDGSAVPEESAEDYTLEMFEKEWAEDYEKLKTDELETREENAEPPDDVMDQARESASEAFDQLSDDEKFEEAKASGDIDDVDQSVRTPQQWKVFQDGKDYDATRTVALYLQAKRAGQLIAERLGENEEWKGIKVDVETLSGKVWGEWKSSSTSALGCALQDATAAELNGLDRMGQDAHLSAEEAYARIAMAAKGKKPQTGRAGAIKLGKAILQAYARATWEASQYVLRKQGIKELTTWRGLMLDKQLIESEGGETSVSMARRGQVGEPSSASAPVAFKKLPGLNLKRNGCASATTSAGIANNWGGINAKAGQIRVVLRIKSPRSAVLSAPCFGQNLADEQETILAGTTWHEWDAWLGRAPDQEYQEVAS